MKKHDGSRCVNSCFLESSITLRVYREMLHCIGFERDKVKRGKFNEWRNRFVVGGQTGSDIWDSLVKKDLATLWMTETGDLVYYLTDLGFEFVAKMENVVIVREEE